MSNSQTLINSHGTLNESSHATLSHSHTPLGVRVESRVRQGIGKGDSKTMDNGTLTTIDKHKSVISQMRSAWRKNGLKLPDASGRVGWSGNRHTLVFEVIDGKLYAFPRTQERKYA